MAKSHKTVRLSSCVSESCPECSTLLDSEELAQNIDHLVNVHGFKLKHVGQETTRDDAGENWQMTVAMLTKS